MGRIAAFAMGFSCRGGPTALDDRTKAKKEFLELAAKSHSPSMELVTKSAEVAKRVTGSVKQEWEAKRERADSYVHAYPFRAVGISVMIAKHV